MKTKNKNSEERALLTRPAMSKTEHSSEDNASTANGFSRREVFADSRIDKWRGSRGDDEYGARYIARRRFGPRLFKSGQPVRERTGLFQDTSAAAQIPRFRGGEANRAQIHNHGHTVLWPPGQLNGHLGKPLNSMTKWIGALLPGSRRWLYARHRTYQSE